MRVPVVFPPKVWGVRAWKARLPGRGKTYYRVGAVCNRASCGVRAWKARLPDSSVRAWKARLPDSSVRAWKARTPGSGDVSLGRRGLQPRFLRCARLESASTG